MLIRAIRGENFMKFRRISLENIPTKGLVGIEGKNEGGKSTIGELLQFALFGKTINTPSGGVSDLITWDQDHCMVEFDFEIKGDGNSESRLMRIWREMDRYGTNYVRLMKLHDGTQKVSEEIASGARQVELALRKILRFEFEDFQRSFFLAEEEFPRSPEKMREFLDRMVGIEGLLEVSEDLKSEITSHEEEFSRLQAEAKRNQQQVEKYLPNIERIPELEQAREAHGTSIENLRADERKSTELLEGLEAKIKEREGTRDRVRSLGTKRLSAMAPALENVLRAYPANHSAKVMEKSKKELSHIREKLIKAQELVSSHAQMVDRSSSAKADLESKFTGNDAAAFPTREKHINESIEAANRAAKGSKNTGIFFFVMALLVGFFAADMHFNFMGDAIWQVAEDSRQVALIVGSIGSALLLFASIVFFSKSGGHGHKAAEAHTMHAHLDSERKIEQKHIDQISNFLNTEEEPEKSGELIENISVKAAKEGVQEFQNKREEVLAASKDLKTYFGALADEENRVVQRLRSSVTELGKEAQKIDAAQKKEQSKRDRTESEIREYQKQDGKRSALEEQNAELRIKSNQVREEIETRQLGIQLINETIDSIRHRTGPSLGRSMRKLLPFVTGGRYTDLKITPDFELEVFTSAKSDFLSPHELSGGTFEGLSIGFRLTFAQAFIRAVTQADQFLFLDEPFKAMDLERMKLCLGILTRLSKDLPQVFVAIPGIAEPLREEFDAIVATTVGVQELTYSADGKPALRIPSPDAPEKSFGFAEPAAEESVSRVESTPADDLSSSDSSASADSSGGNGNSKPRELGETWVDVNAPASSPQVGRTSDGSLEDRKLEGSEEAE